MGSNVKFLKNLSPTVGLYLRMTAENGSWRRLGVQSVDQYFGEVVAPRVEVEAAKQMAQAKAKFPNSDVSRIVIEDGFHESDGDIVPHARVTYEGVNGEHLTRKHVAENANEQSQSDKK